MGQYFMIVNLDKQEYIHPHRLDAGLKFWEICANNVARVVPFLLRRSADGGGGDANDWYEPAPPGVVDTVERTNTCGRWAGDRIVICGDYDRPDQFITVEEALKAGYDQAHINKNKTSTGMVPCTLYEFAQVRFTEISKKVAEDFNNFIDIPEQKVTYRPPRGEN